MFDNDYKQKINFKNSLDTEIPLHSIQLYVWIPKLIYLIKEMIYIAYNKNQK